MKNDEILWVFDVDGVLCDTGQKANKDFVDWFVNWSKNKRIFLVTGGERDKTIIQLGNEIVNIALVTYNCMGNSIWENGNETKINQFTLTDEENTWLESFIQASEFPIRTGRHIESRSGALNFSVVGRNADTEQRIQYKCWDTKTQERIKFIKEFTKNFPRFEAFIGGDTSVDICLNGANKGQCAEKILKTFKGSIYFFGDRCFPNGIDEPLAKKCSQLSKSKVFEVKGFKETQSILERLSKEETRDHMV